MEQDRRKSAPDDRVPIVRRWMGAGCWPVQSCLSARPLPPTAAYVVRMRFLYEFRGGGQRLKTSVWCYRPVSGGDSFLSRMSNPFAGRSQEAADEEGGQPEQDAWGRWRGQIFQNLKFILKLQSLL